MVVTVCYSAQQVSPSLSFSLSGYAYQPAHPPSGFTSTPGPMFTQPDQNSGPAQQPQAGLSASVTTGQATLLPQAFTAGTLHDPTIGA
ncbi:hypothetical protein Tco_0728164 [Tanacetum coccineum]|uniref:Uncharacterized protein n=1 Tax=Tanacetum coccineum TaxID=301880 RepID=A0ABQ4YKF0_9ASTR